MPVYCFYCPENHVTEEYAPMTEIPRFAKCETCGKSAKLGIAPTVNSFMKDTPLSDKSRRQYRHVFDKETRKRLRTTGDVDRALDDFKLRYPHLSRPDVTRKDQLPTLHSLADRRDNNGE